MTGCINPNVLDRINADDAGGQYDSSGGSSGSGNPVGSVCVGCVLLYSGKRHFRSIKFFFLVFEGITTTWSSSSPQDRVRASGAAKMRTTVLLHRVSARDSTRDSPSDIVIRLQTSQDAPMSFKEITLAVPKIGRSGVRCSEHV